MRVANIGKAVLEVGGEQWRAGNTYDTMYEASSLSIDYANDSVGTAYAWTVELRPKQLAGLDGFDPPPSDIEVSGEETLAMFIATANAAL